MKVERNEGGKRGIRHEKDDVGGLEERGEGGKIARGEERKEGWEVGDKWGGREEKRIGFLSLICPP